MIVYSVCSLTHPSEVSQLAPGSSELRGTTSVAAIGAHEYDTSAFH